MGAAHHRRYIIGENWGKFGRKFPAHNDEGGGGGGGTQNMVDSEGNRRKVAKPSDLMAFEAENVGR